MFILVVPWGALGQAGVVCLDLWRLADTLPSLLPFPTKVYRILQWERGWIKAGNLAYSRVLQRHPETKKAPANHLSVGFWGAVLGLAANPMTLINLIIDFDLDPAVH